MVVLKDQVLETEGLEVVVQEVNVQEAEDSVDLVVVILEARDLEGIETEDEEVLTGVQEIEMELPIADQAQIDQDIEVVNSILF